MSDPADRTSKRVLDAHERIAEVLFGLIMVLTFTGSLSIAEAGRDDVRTMLIGALGCNFAWGLIDGVLYLMGCLAERGRGLLTLRAVHQARDPAKAQRLIADALPPIIADSLPAADLAGMHKRLLEQPLPERARFHRADWLGALGVLLLVFLSTLPVAVPFIFMHDITAAKRLSNIVAVSMLFLAGCVYGRSIGGSRLAFGLAMVALGILLVGLTMALGG